MDREFLSGLSRPQIQTLAKQAGVKANDKKEDIILRLLAKDTERVSPRPIEKAKGPMRRSARVARLTSTKQDTVAGVAGVATEVPEVVASQHAEATHQGTAVQGFRQAAAKRPRALKSLDGASSSEVGKVAGNVAQWPNTSAASPLAASAQGATAHNIALQQAEQGSSSQAPSALHRSGAVDLRDAQSTRPRPTTPLTRLPPNVSVVRGLVAGPSHAPFADMTATASWASAPLPVPLRTPRLVPAQWPAPASVHPPPPARPARALQREPARWVPEPAVQPAPAPAPAPMPRPIVSSISIKNAERELAQWEHDDVVALQRIVEVRKLKRGVDEATATISAELDRRTALRLAIERHLLARLKVDRALLGHATWVPDAGYLEWLESQRREQEGVWGVNEDVRHEFAPLSDEEESNEEDFSQFRRGRSSAATPYRPRKRPSDDFEMDPRAQKHRRS
ncbi:hypothetical protein B0H21DRAFT_894692 [Amylocystis lapponica]|nr:hypothetical protein B0H21DRAFT_894692 [Amylocystis lapponica]